MEKQKPYDTIQIPEVSFTTYLKLKREEKAVSLTSLLKSVMKSATSLETIGVLKVANIEVKKASSPNKKSISYFVEIQDEATIPNIEDILRQSKLPTAKDEKSAGVKRGFSTLTKEESSKYGRLSHEQGTAHEWTQEEASEAGKKGGATVSKDPNHMAAIGKIGGQNLQKRKREEKDN